MRYLTLVLLAGCSLTDGVNTDFAALSDGEKKVFEETNELRKNPAQYAAHLRKFRSYYDNRGRIQLPGESVLIATGEGVRAVDEAIRVAENTRPVSELTLSEGLSRSAREHAADLGRSGRVSHTGSNGSTMSQRARRYGTWGGSLAENVGTGSTDWVVTYLFVDDNVASRGHRTNLLGPEYRVIGVGCADHSRYGTVCVQSFAGRFEEAE